MPDDKLLPTSGGRHPVPAEPGLDPAAVFPAPAAREEEEGGGFDVRRYLQAALRYKLLLILALVVGAGGAVLAWKVAPVEYTVTGNLWVQAPRREAGIGDVEPIRQSGLFESSAWIELLRSYAVLDPVAIQERLYLAAPTEYRNAFAPFDLGERFSPGDYLLSIAEDGRQYSLSTKQGVFVERGVLGDSIGRDLGFRWAPPARAFPAGRQLEFSVVPPRDAATALSARLFTRMDVREENFIALSLTGTDPEQTASILNAIMERHVSLAADLKKGKLDEVLEILEQQLEYAQQELESAEQDLEVFRVQTITLPSDASAPIAPGLELTRDPVFDNFFQMRLDLEQVSRDRVRLQSILDSLSGPGSVRVEALQSIPEAAASIELRRVLDELVEARSQLRVLRDRYSDDYPPIQELLRRIGTIESEAVPRVVRSILAELSAREQGLETRVDSASAELTSIPPRTIEEARRRRRVTVQENLYNELRQRVETARLASASSIPDVDILDRASVPRRPTDDKRIPFAAMALLGPLGAALGLAILLDRMDPKVRYPNQVSKEIGLPILGNIPRILSGGPKADENAANVLEAFRELRMTIHFAYGSAGPVTFVITSPGQGEGKSLISTNLAVAFSEVGRRTLLIDGDTRRGSTHRLLGCERSPGLADYLRERSSADIIQRTEYARLDFIGSGTRSDGTPELLASPRMAEFVGTLKRAYDVVIIDTPPLAAGADAVLLSALTGNLALVIRTGTTEKPLAVAKLETLSRLPIRVLGAILNDVEPQGRYYKYYSSYLKGYAATNEDAAEARHPLLTDGAQAS